MSFFKYIDDLLNKVTMYRLVLILFTIIAVKAVALGFLGFILYSGTQLLVSLVVLILACFLSNFLLAKLFRAPVNVESSFITAFILFLILSPTLELRALLILALTALIAMSSKYFISWRKRHIFNPAALSVFIMFVLGFEGATWWVSTVGILTPLILVVGLLIVRKIRRFTMFLVFVLVALASTYPEPILNLIIYWPLIFFGTIMFTEPITTPPTNRLRIIYAVIVGLFFGAQFQFGPVYATPELALLVGNLFAYVTGFKQRLVMTLKEKREVAKGIYEFVFSPSRQFSFTPGQYLEWTLPHTPSDMRGNRRYFSLASSPTEDEVKLGVKFYEPSSSFKKNLLAMQEGSTLSAGQLAGDFVLPRDQSQKLVFIAGGIGVTPFRSMAKYLVDKREKRDIALLYSVKAENEIVYKDLFEQAGIDTRYIVLKFIDEEVIKSVSGWKDRHYYVSGPDPMVRAMKSLLIKMGVSRNRIETDYFPGYA